MPHPAILSLAPDSLASLGELNGESLSELWAVFTKCKDNLQNGRRLENLSWRLWFDSTRRSLDESVTRVTPDDDCNFGREDQQDWSDPENDTDWTEESSIDGDDDDDNDVLATVGATADAVNQAASPSVSNGQTAARSPPVSHRPANRRRSSAQQAPTDINNAPGGTSSHARPPMLKAEWRSSSTISGGSIQRIISSQPPISVPFKSHSVVEVTPIPLISPDAAGITSRHSSAPEHIDPAPITQVHSSARSPRKLVDARTQTTPSSSHRPSPKMSSVALATCANKDQQQQQQHTDEALSGTMETDSKPMTRSTSTHSSSVRLVKSPVSQTGKGQSRRLSSPRPPPPTPATSVKTKELPMPPPSTTQQPQHLVPQSSVKGFDTSAFDNRPRQGSIAPPPTPATALAQLAPSPPKRAPSALKGAPTSVGVTRTPAATAQNAHSKAQAGGTGKKIFFISSPNSDSDDDGGSSCRSTRSRSSDWQMAVQAQAKRSSLSESVKAGDLQIDNAETRPKESNDEEWSEEDEDWSSEYSSGSGDDDDGGRRRAGKNTRQADDNNDSNTLFVKRPSSAALSGQPGELKRRPPGLLSQLFHPDQFLDDADRRHSLIDVRRANGAPPSESLSGLSRGTSESNSPARAARLQTSKSTGMLGDQLAMRRTSRSRSFLKGRPDDVELESSSDDEDEYEDLESSTDAEMLRRQQQQAHLAERLRIEQLTAHPIAPPQTPRSTRRAMLATELSESLRRNLLWERQQRNRVMGGPVNKFKLQQPLAQTAQVQAQQHQQQAANGLIARQATAPPAPEQAVVKQQQQQQQQQQRRPSNTNVLSSSIGNGDGAVAPHPSPATVSGQSAGGEMVRRHTTGAGLYLEGLANGSGPSGDRVHAHHEPVSRPPSTDNRRRGGSHGNYEQAFKGLTSMTVVSPPHANGTRQKEDGSATESDDDDDSSSDGDEDDEVPDKGKRDQPLTRRKSTFSSIWGQKVW
ncbi:hypothetical protein OIO90_000466 [Microbotryomycetes sp. JL221]|nr:hypothetical protein OIO90_000466 [Microbotryomycetes sp. JL221]